MTRRAPPLVATTDAGGHYVLDRLEPGHYSLFVARSGYVPQMYGQTKANREGRALIVERGRKLQGIDFRLIATVAIAGRVLGEDNEPIVGASVQAFTSRYVDGQRRFIGGAAPASTNDLGEYRIYGLAPGRYYVGVSGQEPRQTGIASRQDAPAEERYVATLYPNATELDYASAIDVQPGREALGIDIVASKSPTFQIRGKILGFGPTDQYARVQLEEVGVGWEITRRGADMAPDARGNFDFSGITPGSYVVSTILYQSGKFTSAWRLIQVVDADVDDVNLDPSTGMELQGRVRVEGSKSIDLRKLSLGLSNPYAPVQTRVQQLASDGSFVLHAAGRYVYRIEIFGLPEDFYLKSVRLGDEAVAGTSLDLGNAEGPQGALEIVISGTGGRIDGLLKNEKDEPASGAVVVLIPDLSHRWESYLFKNTTTDQNGRFAIRGIRPGDYKLFAWDDIEPGAWWDPEFLSQYEAKGEEIKIEANGHAAYDLHLISTKPE